MPSKNSKRGSDTERELVKKAVEFGLPAIRAYASNGKSLGEAEDVDVKIADIRVQCKRRKTLPAYLQIPDSCDCVYFRQDRGDKLVLINLEWFLELIGGSKWQTGSESTGAPSVPSVSQIPGVPSPPVEASSSACELSQTTLTKKEGGSTSTSHWTSTELPPPPSLP